MAWVGFYRREDEIWHEIERKGVAPDEISRMREIWDRATPQDQAEGLEKHFAEALTTGPADPWRERLDAFIRLGAIHRPKEALRGVAAWRRRDT